MNEPEVLLETARFRVVRQRGRTPDGQVYERETIQHPGAVVILPLLDGDRVCLIRNYRIAIDRTLIELPAGTLEAGEDPVVAARRELEEETGFRAARFEPLLQFFMSPGIMNERMHVFVASDLAPRRQQLDLGEQIEPLIATWQEAMTLVATGQIQDAKSLVALLLYDRQRR